MEFEKLQKIISEVLNVDAEEITMETASMFYLRNRNKTQKQTKGFYK